MAQQPRQSAPKPAPKQPVGPSAGAEGSRLRRLPLIGSILRAWDALWGRPARPVKPPPPPPSPEEILARQRKLAYSKLCKALASNVDELILDANVPILENYPEVTAEQRQRIVQARQTLATLHAFWEALASGDDAAIVAAYKPELLDGSNRISQAERDWLNASKQRIEMVQAVRRAIARNAGNQNEIAIAAAYKPELAAGRQLFDDAETRQIDRAVARVSEYNYFRAVLASNNDRWIAERYGLSGLEGFPLQPAESERLNLAALRLQAVEPFRAALRTNDDGRIVAAYSGLLAPPEPRQSGILAPQQPDLLPPAERVRYALALSRQKKLSQLKQSLKAGTSDAAITKDYEEAFDGSPELTPEDHWRIRQARERTAALAAFRQALRTKDDQRIVQAYDTILDDSPDMTDEERKELDGARGNVQLAWLAQHGATATATAHATA
jgi:hypothetical protein